MSNFEAITPAHIAVAMAATTPKEAVDVLWNAAQPGAFKPVYSIDCSEKSWSATSLAIRHGLLMEWLAAEILEAGGL